MTIKMLHYQAFLLTTLSFFQLAQGFITSSSRPARKLHLTELSESFSQDSQHDAASRRVVLQEFGKAALVTSNFLLVDEASAAESFRPAVRPTAYRVDSTQPPTLLPIAKAKDQTRILSELGKGKGTDKEMIVDDSVNLNNILNKAVFGTIDAVSSLVQKGGEDLSGTGYASFLCLGMPYETTPTDVELAKSLMGMTIQNRDGSNTALGLHFCPISVQPALDAFIATGDKQALRKSLSSAGVAQNVLDIHDPLIEAALAKRMRLLALSPEQNDIRLVRKDGIKSLSPDARSAYVVDPEGFIASTQDKRFRVYADRSLLKDFEQLDANDSSGSFFSERILVHETAAGVAARYASEKPGSMVIVVAPTRDVRYLQGINGRIPRVSRALSSDSKVTDNMVTTILVNPTAKETLSKTRFLRLEVGTSPETLDYQSKVADYLWFSSSPKVNLIPRLMNA